MTETEHNLIPPFMLRRRSLTVRLLACLALLVVSLPAADPLVFAQEAAAQEPAAKKPSAKPTRLIDRQPFDRITLDAVSGGEVIDTLLLEFPDRRVPSPLPTSGSLELRRLSEPSVLYTVPWGSIEQLQLYEQLLLLEADALTQAKDLAEGYEYLSFLYKNYPDISGLKAATNKYLRLDAQLAYGEKNYEETLTILLSLYDLDPTQRGLKRFVETVTDRMIESHLAERDFAAARSVLDLLNTGFEDLNASNAASWQEKFERGADRQLQLAQQAIASEDYSEARQAIRRALAILPNVRDAAQMLDEINRKSPQIVVGVDQLRAATPSTLEWVTARTAQLTDPKLVRLTDFGAEGGDYSCGWAKLSSDDTGLQLKLAFNAGALQQGFSTEVLALDLLNQADPHHRQFRPDFAGLLSKVEISDGNQVTIHWLRSHVRPESLLTLPLTSLLNQSVAPGEYQVSQDEEDKDAVTYQLATKNVESTAPETVIERYYENEEVAFAALLDGEIDAIARVAPWQLERLQQTRKVTLSPYRLPTVHVLLPNYDKPLMGRREFRRALCYGIDRPQILNDILLGGDRRPGFRVLSAPFPSGITITDPVGYAYNEGRQPRSYEPRLAAVLASVARNSLAKLAAMKKKAAQPETDTEAPESDEENEESEAPAVEVRPLILVHPRNPVATTVCQTIKLQLGAIGIPVQLQPIEFTDGEITVDYDLRYAELAVWEPLVDARRLLGPEGLAGHCSSPMSLALSDIEKASNWKEIRARFKEVHDIAYNDLPVIPLWQTIDYFAYRESLLGVGTTPVTLYQNVSDWRRASTGGSR